MPNDRHLEAAFSFVENLLADSNKVAFYCYFWYTCSTLNIRKSGMLKSIDNVPVVYLAGGMKSGWQDAVKRAVPGIIFIDPRDHGLQDENGYTAWDLAGVERADVVFGYMESDNPGGAGLAVEFGWGARADKLMLLVEQDGYPQQRYFGMVRALSHVRYEGPDGLARAVEALTRIRNEGVNAFKAKVA